MKLSPELLLHIMICDSFSRLECLLKLDHSHALFHIM